MFTSLEEFYADAEMLLAVFDSFVERRGLAPHARTDHICYKCGSRESFEHIRALLEHESDFMYQSIISRRRIAYKRLKQPFETLLGDIYYLELSDQKPDGSQVEGFDHIEVYPVAMTYDAFVDTLAKEETIERVERPHHTTDDIRLPGDFLFRCTQGPLIEKIFREEVGLPSR